MRLDAATVEILRNCLQGAVEEMAYVVERTAYTTFVKETADFTCGLLNPSGEFFAYPVELGVASFGGISYAATLEAVGPLEPGDVIITNDPYGSAAAATHLPDIHLIRPSFHYGRPAAPGAGFLPSPAAGGTVPGGPAAAAEEALRARRGEPRPARRDPRQLPHPRAELGRPAGAGGRAHDRRAAHARAHPALRVRHRRQGPGRSYRLRGAQGRGADPPHAGGPL